MELRYNSTRGGETGVTASMAILNGLAADGGLYMPERIPALDVTVEELAGMTYQDTAYAVMKQFLTDFTETELKRCIRLAYDDKFDTEEIAPLAKASGLYFLELYHGKTIAFKDMALSILPHLMTTAAAKNHVEHEIAILAATSGDTGKAAMAGFANVPGTRIIVFYPKGGVSRVQELQMLTQEGANTCVVGIDGNFDDAQSGVKQIFGDREFAGQLAQKGFWLSSANSINIGRLIPQIVYYVYAYAKLYANEEIKPGETIDVTVPTGNFGNILAAYVAKQMGLPFGRLICASNDNRVLCDFFETGVYDKNREFFLTTSPSMDILVSSNLERLIYLSCGRSAEKTSELMARLSSDGRYEITGQMREFMADFCGGSASQQETARAIRDIFEGTGYLIDPHTGVAAAVADRYRRAGAGERKMLVASTASPYKFPKSVMEALSKKSGGRDEFDLVDEMEALSGVPIPGAVREIRAAKILHNRRCAPENMAAAVRDILSET